jgi:tol-pal system protein YbgF
MRLRAPVIVTLLLLGANPGCARSAEERQLDAMQEEIEHIQADRDIAAQPEGASEPVDPASSRSAPLAPVAPAPPAIPPPPIDLGSAAQSDSAEADDYADPEDVSPRPKIRVFGSPRTSGRNRGGDDPVEQVVSDDSTGSSLDPEAKRAYDAALALVNAHQFGPGLEALAAFLVKWPDHPYVDHAMYWRGECYFAQADYAHASEQFEGVLARFPAGMKAPDALLKLGMCHQKLGHAAQARACFDRLVQDYPQSDAARHAPAPLAEDRR